MLLAVDVGNSNVVYGIHESGDWKRQWREETHARRSMAEEEALLRSYFLEYGLRLSDIEQVVLSSVVPERTPDLERILHRLFGKRVLVVNDTIYTYLPLQIRNAHEIGSDLVANALGGHLRFPEHVCTVVDFGTALTFTTVAPNGKILGVSIAPGLKTAIRTLSTSTAKLPEVPLQYPESALGQNTVHAIQAGVLVGYSGMVKNMLYLIRRELEHDQELPELRVIATGGLSSILTPLKDEFELIDPMLTLSGLRAIAQYVPQPDSSLLNSSRTG